MSKEIQTARKFQFDKYSIMITICFFLVSSYVAFFHHNYWTFDVDGIYYLIAGEEILSGNGKDVVMLHSPVGGSILFASINLIFNDGFAVIKGLSVLSATGMVFFAFHIMRNVFDVKTSRLGHLFFALNPWVFLFSIQARNELIPVFLVMAATFFVTKKEILLRDIVIIGLLLGSACMIRYQSAFILIAFVIFLLINNKKMRKKFIQILLLIIIFSITTSPVFLYNYFTNGTLLDEVDPSRYIADRSKFSNEEWKDEVFMQSQGGILDSIFVDFDLWKENYFYNLLYGIPNSLFGFEDKVSLSILPAIPILGLITVLGGVVYSMKLKYSKKNFVIILSTIAITVTSIFLFGNIQNHFFAIIIVPLMVLGIINWKNIDRNFLPIFLIPIVFALAIAIIPVRGPHHLLFIWVCFAALSAVFFTKMLPIIFQRIQRKKEKIHVNNGMKMTFIILIVIFASLNMTYSYIQLKILSSDEPFISIQDEIKRIQNNMPLETVGKEMEEIANVLSKEPNIEDSYVGGPLAYHAYLESNRIFFNYIEEPKNDSIENYVTRENWTFYDKHYSNLHSWPLDRYDESSNLPDYFIYPPHENHHEFLNKLTDPENPEIPSNFELIHKGSKGTMVYKIVYSENKET